MPVTVVVGGQYGSEGKGKVAWHWHWRSGAHGAVRVGGANSGHTVVSGDGTRHVLRQLPVAVLDDDAELFLPAGNYLDVKVLLAEIDRYSVDPSRLAIDPEAAIITDEDRSTEQASDLSARIGSTASGTGAAVLRRIARDPSAPRAASLRVLAPYLRPTGPRIRSLLSEGSRMLVEGTQGFGLSVLHGGHGPYATSRDTTAAGFLSEAGLSPLDVDEIVLVLRAFPIRVAGNSGPLEDETTWAAVAERSAQAGLVETTTVTHRIRRVAEFHPGVVRRALEVNKPTTVVLNHADYLGDLTVPSGRRAAKMAVDQIEQQISRTVDFVGDGPGRLQPRSAWLLDAAEPHCEQYENPSPPCSVQM